MSTCDYDMAPLTVGKVFPEWHGLQIIGPVEDQKPIGVFGLRKPFPKKLYLVGGVTQVQNAIDSVKVSNQRRSRVCVEVDNPVLVFETVPKSILQSAVDFTRASY